jgi:4-phospho-D-threonate 3-dehydrogenase / 4-phospho-D-erythronate 3-dehydrogenase
MIVGVTMGDSSGVGPEILLKAAASGELTVSYVVYGDVEVLTRSRRELGMDIPLWVITNVAEYKPGVVNIIDHSMLRENDVTPGKLNALSGQAARQYVISAATAALRKEIDAIVTLPMNKEATQLTDPNFTGHTELIGEVCGSDDVTIMLASDQLIVTHVSTHCSLREAIERARPARIQRIIELTCEAVARLKPSYRVAVAGLNPHAGENGLFGDEEILYIAPAVKWAQERGLPVDGPHPPDTLFYAAVQRKKYDAVVCMYHDQGHIPSKLLDFEGGVNIALGLPIIRTSVDHGTAFDIAWKGSASTTSFLRAVDFAVRLALANSGLPAPR